MSLSDTELIIQSQKGDESSFEELVYRYDKLVLSLALKYLGNDDDAKDAYQEVFIRVYKSIRNFKFQSEFSTWLYRITSNVCYSIKAKSKRYEHVSISNDEDDLQIAAEFGSPDNIAMNKEINSKVNEALNLLSKKQKMVFVLKHFEGYKIREIAEMTNTKEGTVKKYLFEAIHKLRQILSPVYG